jgi:hypothetical protein
MRFNSVKPRLAGDSGITLIETVISVAVFLIVSVATYQSFTTLFQTVALSRAQVVAAALANEQFEIVRNLPYVNVGIVGGLPAGTIPQSQTIVRSGLSFGVVATIRSVDDSFDGRLGFIPNDTTPSDYKFVQFDISCASCSKSFGTMHFSSLVAPLALETPATSGALFVQAIDANGHPLAGANVHIVNTSVNPNITIDDTTNNAGLLQIVDAPPGTNAYNISVTKSGYSTDRTYPPGGVGNPNPIKADATVLAQQITQLSFAIDQQSTLNVSTLTNTCAAVPSLPFSVAGNKAIGATPTILKYSQNFTTDGAGAKSIPGLEWDSYNPVLTSSSYDTAGTIPLTPFALNPGSTQNFQFVVAPKNPHSILVTVQDAATSLSVTGASVTLSDGGAFSQTLTTGRGFLSQSDWSGGSGQVTIGDATKYFDSDGNIDTTNPSGDLHLKQIFGTPQYQTSGVITSSTFDTGSASNFYQISWLPQDEPVQAGDDSVRFQIATNNDNATWNFIGPDGTAGSYYTIANTNINAANNGNRYLRYKLYLQTANANYTPTISDLSVTYNSLCVPPGQVFFTGLPVGTYDLSISNAGYQTWSGTVDTTPSWQQTQVTLLPQ